MKKSIKSVISLIIIAFAVFSAISFLAPFDKNATFYLSYALGAVAILAQLYIFKFAFDGSNKIMSKFYAFPIARLGIIYLVVQLVASFIFMIVSATIEDSNLIWLPALIYILILSAAAIGTISADAVRNTIERQDVELKQGTQNMQLLQSKVNSLQGLSKDAVISNKLNNLIENIRYSDPVSSVSLNEIETRLMGSINHLEQALISGNDSGAVELLGIIQNILDERNHLCKLNKGN